VLEARTLVLCWALLQCQRVSLQALQNQKVTVLDPAWPVQLEQMARNLVVALVLF